MNRLKLSFPRNRRSASAADLGAQGEERMRRSGESSELPDGSRIKSGMTFIREVVVAPMRLWHSTARWRKPRCRFLPSCSEYSIEVVRETGVIRGLYLSLRRVMRCHPWGGEGFDPVRVTGSHSVTEGISEQGATLGKAS